MLIVHRCACGHPDLFHVNPRDPSSECSYSWCHATEHSYGPPEVIPSWDAAGRVVADIVPPGARVSPYPPTCECDACGALYCLHTSP